MEHLLCPGIIVFVFHIAPFTNVNIFMLFLEAHVFFTSRSS